MTFTQNETDIIISGLAQLGTYLNLGLIKAKLPHISCANIDLLMERFMQEAPIAPEMKADWDAQTKEIEKVEGEILEMVAKLPPPLEKPKVTVH